MKSIGIDIGTTTISFNVVDSSGPQVWRKETLDNGSFLETGHPWERIQDVGAIVGKVVGALEELWEEDVAAVGLTGQMHGIVYVDGEGRAVSPLYTWQDGRGDLPVFEGKSVCQLLGEQGVKAAAGYGTVTHLYNLKQGLVPAGAVTYCTIADYVGMVLTGRKRPLLHASQAASLGLFNGERCSFQGDAARVWGMDPGFFPEVTQELELLGEYRGVPVSVSLGDNQASFLGSVRRARETLLVNVGTGAQISVLSTRCGEWPGIEVRPFVKGTVLLVGATLCGGAAYADLERFFREYAAAAGAPDVPQYGVMKALLDAQPAPQEAWKVRTTFAGTREDPKAAGSVEGIRRENFRPAWFIRGVLAGMAEELYGLYETLQQQAGISRSVLVASGNGVRQNPALQQLLSRRFRMPLQVVENQEEAAFGGAVSGLAAVGALSLEQWLGL